MTPLQPEAATVSRLAALVDAGMPQLLSEIEGLIRIPSVSSLPAHFGDVERSARTTADLLADAGFDEVDIVREPGGTPSVIARSPAPGNAPTVLLYAHHDVQPPGELSDWESAPFEPAHRGERLFGRGAADDKAGLAVHLAAVRAHRGSLPVGVTVLVEGEEEIGSPTLGELLKNHREKLDADVIVIADAINWAVGVPALTVSLRGLVEAVVEVRTLRHQLHSGAWGGAVPDALSALVRVLSTLYRPDGGVAVAGLGSAARPKMVEYEEERLRADAGVLPGVQLPGTGSLTDRLWHGPTVTITGIDCPSVADASNTLAASARAKISMRIAPGDDPSEAFDALAAHLRENVPGDAHLDVTLGASAHPHLIDIDNAAHHKAMAALRLAWDGNEPVEVGVGGSIPLIRLFADAFPDAAVLVTGVEDPDTRAHGANESLHLGEFRRACVAEAILLELLGDDPGSASFARA